MRDWAQLTFYFMITQNPVHYSNLLGHYVVAGKTDIRVVMDLRVLEPVDFSGFALEQILGAGGSIYTFMIREASSISEGTVFTAVSSRVDERNMGLNYTHRIQETRLPTQDIEFATEAGQAQAYYHYSSIPTCNDSGTPIPVPLNSSYYTTGTNLMLYSAYSLGNGTRNLTHDMSIGLDMSGFVGARDWVMRNIPVLAVTIGAVAALVGTSTFAWKKKRKMAMENGESMMSALEGKDSGGT